MVQCYTCSTAVGNWNFDPKNYNNGTYTGVNAYFAYNGPNWIYCFCPSCFANGNFAKHLKSWYPGPIQTIV